MKCWVVGITWLSSSASNYQIVKTRFFSLKLFPVKTAQWQWGLCLGRKELKWEKFLQWTCKPNQEPRDGEPTWNYSAKAAGLLKDLHDSSHRSMRTSSTTKNCTKDRRVVCAWGGSLLTTDVINPRGFCVETRPISLQVPFSRRSQMQLSSAPQAAGTAVTTESSHKKQQPSQRKSEGQGTQRHLPSLLLYPLSSRFLLSLYGKTGKKS